MKYRVTYCYEGQVTIDVEDAESKEDAEKQGLQEADEAILHNLSVCNVCAREKP